MIDVHPPHHPAHSWRDFLIHIATIVVGLIIAVGIEQTVEAIRRHHDRTEIVERLRREAEDNIAPLDASRKSMQKNAAWEGSVVALLRTTPEQEGFVTITLPPLESTGSQTTQRAAWSVAKANGTLALLPESTQEVFDRVDWFAEQADFAVRQEKEAFQYAEATAAAAGVSLEPGKVVRFPAAQRYSLVMGMAKLQSAETEQAYYFAVCEAADMAIRENPSSAVELQKAEVRMRATLTKN